MLCVLLFDVRVTDSQREIPVYEDCLGVAISDPPEVIERGMLASAWGEYLASTELSPGHLTVRLVPLPPSEEEP